MKYVVVEGDYLRGLAERFLGDEMQWRTIWEMNRATLRSGNPDLIYPGEVLEIPSPEPVKLETVDNPEEVSLFVNDKIFQGWTGVKIRRSLEAVSGSFSLELVEQWSKDADPWPIFTGDKAVIRIGNDTMITGYIDDVSISVSADSRTVSVSGRDKTCDIVDCSAINRPGQWFKKRLEAIAKDLCGPFGVSVKVEANTGGIIENMNLQPGETVFETLERAAKQRKILISSTPEGELLLTQSGNTRIDATLKEGENILTCEASFSDRDRFSKYFVEGQGSAALRGNAEDESVKRFRPLTIVSEEKATAASVVDRAKWEARVRAAKASTVSVTVQGWRLPSGEIWRVNRLVNIECPSVRVSGEMLITDFEFSKDNGGTVTNLTLKRKDAYLPEGTLPKFNEPVK